MEVLNFTHDLDALVFTYTGCSRIVLFFPIHVKPSLTQGVYRLLMPSITFCCIARDLQSSRNSTNVLSHFETTNSSLVFAREWQNVEHIFFGTPCTWAFWINSHQTFFLSFSICWLTVFIILASLQSVGLYFNQCFAQTCLKTRN